MRLSNEAWNFQEDNFGELLPYVKDTNITDINYNGSDVWVEDLEKGILKTNVKLSQAFENNSVRGLQIWYHNN